MGVTVTRNFGPLDQITLLTRDDWGRVGRFARERIILRTRNGQDVNGNAFTAYSEGYAKAKAAIGASASPNLTLSGQMLNSITVEPDDQGVTLGFSN